MARRRANNISGTISGSLNNTDITTALTPTWSNGAPACLATSSDYYVVLDAGTSSEEITYSFGPWTPGNITLTRGQEGSSKSALTNPTQIIAPTTVAFGGHSAWTVVGSAGRPAFTNSRAVGKNNGVTPTGSFARPRPDSWHLTDTSSERRGTYGIHAAGWLPSRNADGDHRA